MTKLLALSVLIFSLSAPAGVRTVGNGGGFGEMKAYLALQQMGRQIQLCLALSQICNLSLQERTLFQQVAKSLPEEQRLTGLKFFDDPSLVRTVETEGQVGAPISINSYLLTDESGIAASYQKISGYILYGLLKHQAAQNTGLWDLALSSMAGFHEELLSTRLSMGVYNPPLVHHLLVSSSYDSEVIFESMLIEDVGSTHDLISNSDLAHICPGQQTPKVKIRNFGQGNSTDSLSVHTQWSCDGVSWGEAILNFQFQLDRDEHIILPIETSTRGLVKPQSGV